MRATVYYCWPGLLTVIILNFQQLHSFTLPKTFQSHEHSVPTAGLDRFLLPSSPSLSYSLSPTSLHSTEDDDGRRRPPYRSIGEVVGGLHGGKYQFGAGSGVIDPNFSGRGSRRSSTDVGDDGNDHDDDDDMPNWARRMGLSSPPPDVATGIGNVGVVEVPSNANRSDGILRTASISIVNDERTWEKYYAKIVPVVTGGASDPVELTVLEGGGRPCWEDIPFCVTPRTGFLAPRGGANNACDASKPYSDSITLCVYHREGTLVEMPSLDVSDIDTAVEWWLVAGTEEDKWYYKLALL